MTTFRPTSAELEAFMADPSRRDDPYPLYHLLQDRGPVYYPPLRAWLLTRHADVLTVLRHPGTSSMRSSPGLRGIDAPSDSTRVFARSEEMVMLNRDPPDHTRLRRMVNRAFSSSAVAGMEERISGLAKSLLEPYRATGRMDLLHDYAYPLPLLVISELLGVPTADRPLFAQWASALGGRFGVHPQRTPAARRAGNHAMTELLAYLRALMTERRAQPRDDLVSNLVAVADETEQLTDDELLANCAFLLNAGHETTANAIGNGMLALFLHPDELRRLRADGALLRTVADELLRFDTSLQLTPRLLLSDIEIGGVLIPAGSRLFLMLGACNRDPLQFPSPDRLDVSRLDNNHLSFGWGIHHCLGAQLARLEIMVAIRTLLDSCPGLERDSKEIAWRDHFSLRGLQELPVRWDVG